MLIKNRYNVIQPLARGGFSQTFLAEDRDRFDQLCVVKQLSYAKDHPEFEYIQRLFEQEARVLQTLGRELGRTTGQIPELCAFFTEAEQFYLVQEWIDGETLTDQLRNGEPLAENAVRELLKQVLPILSEIHARGIVHRDIKPSNLILRKPDGKPVLIDFGAVKGILNALAQQSGQIESSTCIGTPGFMAPEQEECRPVEPSTDLYSLGITAIYALTKKQPQEWAANLLRKPQWQRFAAVSPGFAAILNQSIQRDTSKRYHSAQDMLDAILTLETRDAISSTLLPTIPPTRVESPTRPAAPPARWPAVALAVAGALSAMGLGYVYLDYQTAQTTLVRSQQARDQGDHQTCIAEAQRLIQSHALSYFNPVAQAEQLQSECATAADLQTYLRDELPQQLRQQNRADKNHVAQLIEDIHPTVQVSGDQVMIAYDPAARPKLADDPSFMVSIFMGALRGSPDAFFSPEYTNFSQLIVEVQGSSAQATITVEQWNMYLNDYKKASESDIEKLRQRFHEQIPVSK